MRLNHLALTVSDARRSAAFYREHFGFERTLHEDDHFTMLADEAGDLLALFPGRPPSDPPASFHFGFELDSVDEVRRERDRLQQAGVSELEWEDSWMTRLRVADPDGYGVELFASP